MSAEFYPEYSQQSVNNLIQLLSEEVTAIQMTESPSGDRDINSEVLTDLTDFLQFGKPSLETLKRIYTLFEEFLPDTNKRKIKPNWAIAIRSIRDRIDLHDEDAIKLPERRGSNRQLDALLNKAATHVGIKKLLQREERIERKSGTTQKTPEELRAKLNEELAKRNLPPRG